MKQILLAVMALFLFTTAINAQRPPGGGGGRGGFTPSPVPFKGQVIDAETGEALEYATISVFSMRDSSLIAGNITDEKGLFSFEGRNGRFWMTIEYLGYATKKIEGIRVSRDVAIHKDLANAGTNASDLLDNIPSVQVSVEGQVSLRGSENVRILIDGKPSGLIGVSGTNGLRNIQANMIERVEIITNPSAKFEAEGTAGIINIVLKKDRKKGLNGSFDLTAGVPTNYGISFGLNYRQDKLNFFTNVGLSKRENPGVSSQNQEFYVGDTTFLSQQASDRLRGGVSGSFRFGADYYLSDMDILTAAATLRLSDDANRAETSYRDYINTLDNFISGEVRIDEETEDELKQEYSLSYEKKYANKKQKLTADVRYQSNLEAEGSDLTNTFINESGTSLSSIPYLIQRSNNEELEERLIFQLDYEQPVGEEGKFEVGARSGFRTILNDYLVEDDVNGEWVALANFSNNFEYKEDVHAAYATFGNKKGKFSYQAGLRAEYYDINTELKQTQEVNNIDSINVFPSAFLGYELPGGSQIQASYSRRIRRPRFRDLNPFFTFSDNRNFFSGNPNLQPEFTNSYELSHVKYWEKGSLSSAIYYRHTDNKIQRIIRFNDDGTTIRRPENLAIEDAYGIEFTAAYAPFKWWRLNGDFNFFRGITTGGELYPNLNADTYTWFTRGTSRWTIKKDIDVQLRFNYRAPRETTQGLTKSLYSFDLAANKDVLKGKGTLTLSVRDILNSRRRRYISEGPNFMTEGDFQWRSRVATLTFSYRLNQKKRRGRGGRSGGGEFEGGEEF